MAVDNLGHITAVYRRLPDVTRELVDGCRTCRDHCRVRLILAEFGYTLTTIYNAFEWTLEYFETEALLHRIIHVYLVCTCSDDVRYNNAHIT